MESSKMALRPYQVQAIEQLDAAIADGANSPLLVCPTGSGKTVIAAALIRRAVENGQRALFLAPRRELVTQASRALAAVEIEHGVILAGADEAAGIDAPVQVASVDTLRSRLDKSVNLPAPGLVIVDEAHLSITEKRQELLNSWPDALRIGLTATPTRKDGRALGNLYDAIVEPVTTAELQESGYLCQARYYSLSEPDLSEVKLTAGDYNQGQLDAAINRPDLVGNVVETWLARADFRRTVVFATSIKHSKALCRQFCRAGIFAEHVDANTPQAERDAIFERFSTGETQVLCNCFLASYGFDLPALSCVVLARPTRSLMLYLQMIGRGLRPTDDKPDCLILDHSGCVFEHGLAHEKREWTLEGKSALVEHGSSHKRRNDNRHICPECSAVFSDSQTCPECGHYLTPKGAELITLAGELIEVGAGLAPEQQDRMVFYLELRGLGLQRKWNPKAAACKYKERYDEWPPRAWNELPIAVPSTETRRYVKKSLAEYSRRQGGGIAAVTGTKKRKRRPPRRPNYDAMRKARRYARYGITA